MAKPTKRGKQILYYGIPDDVHKMILDTQKQIKKEKKRGQVSLSAAITKLLKLHLNAVQ